MSDSEQPAVPAPLVDELCSMVDSRWNIGRLRNPQSVDFAQERGFTYATIRAYSQRGPVAVGAKLNTEGAKPWVANDTTGGLANKLRRNGAPVQRHYESEQGRYEESIALAFGGQHNRGILAVKEWIPGHDIRGFLERKRDGEFPDLTVNEAIEASVRAIAQLHKPAPPVAHETDDAEDVRLQNMAVRFDERGEPELAKFVRSVDQQLMTVDRWETSLVPVHHDVHLGNIVVTPIIGNKCRANLIDASSLALEGLASTDLTEFVSHLARWFDSGDVTDVQRIALPSAAPVGFVLNNYLEERDATREMAAHLLREVLAVECIGLIQLLDQTRTKAAPRPQEQINRFAQNTGPLINSI